MRIAFLFATCLWALAGPAYAGAWTQNAGSGIAIVSADYYATDQFFNNQGHTQPQPTYSQYALNPYLEYGLRDGLTIGANLLLLHDHQDSGPGSPAETNFGLGASEFFLRQRLWQQDGFVVSAQPMVKLPSPESSSALPRFDSTTPDAGIGLSAGYSFSAYGQNHYASLDTQYRYRFGTPTNQVNLAGTLGIGLTPLLTLMPQTFLTYRTSAPANAAFTESSGDDYNLIKLQLSAVYKWTDSTSFQAGGFASVDGKNTGSGHGVLLAVWKYF